MSGSSTSMIVEPASPDSSRSPRASARLRTTCLCTCDSGGTSITTSPSSCVWQDSRRPGCKPALLVVALLDRGEGSTDDRLREAMPCLANSPSPTRDLAAAADRPPAADRIDIDAERARRLQHRRAEREAPALAGGREDDQGVATGSGHQIDLTAAAAALLAFAAPGVDIAVAGARLAAVADCGRSDPGGTGRGHGSLAELADPGEAVAHRRRSAHWRP